MFLAGVSPAAIARQDSGASHGEMVKLYVSVLDIKGHPVTDLKADDIRVIENGHEQKVVQLSQEHIEPLTIGLLIDVSGSRRDEFPTAERTAANEFLQRSLRPGDKAFVLTFSEGVHIAQEVTSDPAPVLKAIEEATSVRPRGSTALFDAISFACQKLLASETGRNVLLIISDMQDNASRVRLDTAIQEAQRQQASLWTIDIDSFYYSVHKKESIVGWRSARDLAGQTGGQAYLVDKRKDLDTAFASAAEAVQSTYLLQYASTNLARDGRFRKIKVEVTRQHCEVLAPAGYYAPKQ